MDGMNEKSREISAEVMRHMKEIKALLEANGGVQYLSMTIFEDETIMFHNGYGLKGKDCKGLCIHGFIEGESNGND